MSKDELSEERIALVQLRCESRRDFSGGFGVTAEGRAAETTLALIESRKQALEFLRRVRAEIGYSGVVSIDTIDCIAAFLEQNQ